MQKVMKLFPELFRMWITKHVSHFNGTNRMLSQYPATETCSKVQNRCPNCGCFGKSMAHITWYRDKGRTVVFLDSVENLQLWLEEQQTNPEVTHLFRSYLLAYSTRTMKSLLPSGTRYLVLASEYHDQFGWDYFLEGRICTLWVETRSRDLADCHLDRNTDH